MEDAVDRTEVFAGRLISVDVARWVGDTGESIEREVVRHPGAVLIVPMLDDERVVMIRNRRVAVGETLWEFPAGTAEPNEDAVRTAAREVQEETGYRAGHVELIGTFFTSLGFCDELMRVFVARDLEHVGQSLEPHEEIDVQAMAIDAVRAMAMDGRLRDGKSLAALLLFDGYLKNKKTGSGIVSGIGSEGTSAT